ncbi:MAG: hypothetical protein CMM48_13230 [Rhodospirillaceae bacterium]|nr:hypothetical protein [Rhodospirillaceae bacterium]HAA92076.1 hypothetical protein [Rhodospirillaceae bacterium]
MPCAPERSTPPPPPRDPMENPRKRDAILPVSVMLCMHTLIALTVFVVPVMAPEIGMGAEAISLFVLLLYFTSMITVPFSGPCTARFGPMRMMQLCVLACAAGVALCCVATSEAIYGGGVLIGIGLGLATPAASDILLRYTPESIRSFIFSLKQAGVPAGNLIAGLLVWLALAIGWQNAFLLTAAVGATIAIVFQPLRKTWDEGRETDTRIRVNRQSYVNGLRMIKEDKAIRWLSMSSFVFVLLQVSTTSYIVTFLVEDVGRAHETAGSIYALAFAGGFFARVLFGVVADNFIPPLKTLGILGLVMGAAAIATAQFNSDWSVYAIGAVTFLLASTAAGWNGVFIAETAARAPKGQVSHVLGISLILTYAGCIATPPIFLGLLALSDGSYSFAFSLIAVPAILVGIRLLLLKPDQV